MFASVFTKKYQKVCGARRAGLAEKPWGPMGPHGPQFYIGGWGCEPNREIIDMCALRVGARETMCFLSLGRAAATCATPAAPSLVFPCVFPVILVVQ